VGRVLRSRPFCMLNIVLPLRNTPSPPSFETELKKQGWPTQINTWRIKMIPGHRMFMNSSFGGGGGSLFMCV
jgi:hypothetical protein